MVVSKLIVVVVVVLVVVVVIVDDDDDDDNEKCVWGSVIFPLVRNTISGWHSQFLVNVATAAH